MLAVSETRTDLAQAINETKCSKKFEAMQTGGEGAVVPFMCGAGVLYGRCFDLEPTGSVLAVRSREPTALSPCQQMAQASPNPLR